METTSSSQVQLHLNTLNIPISSTLKQQIMCSILEFQEIQKKKRGLKSRNLLNKWFQDSLKNYIMEAHAAPLLENTFNMHSVQEIKRHIHKQLDKTIPKYMGILKAYYEALKRANRGTILEQKLINIINKNSQDLQENPSQMKSKDIRKRFLCLLILTYFQESESKKISSFFDLWNICFLEQLGDLQGQPKKTIHSLNSEFFLFSNELSCEERCESLEQAQEGSYRDIDGKEEYYCMNNVAFSQEQKDQLRNNLLPIHNYNQQSNTMLGCALDYERDTRQADYDDDYDPEITSFNLPEMNGYLDPSFIPDSYNVYFMDELF